MYICIYILIQLQYMMHYHYGTWYWHFLFKYKELSLVIDWFQHEIKMPQRLEFTVVEVSSEDDGFKGANLPAIGPQVETQEKFLGVFTFRE